MKPKEVLLKHGRIQAITRGRISADNHKFLADLAAKGEKIDGYESVVTSKPTGEKVYKNAQAPASTEKVVAEIHYRYPLDTPAHAFIDGKKVSVSMKEACGNFRVSLVCCSCGQPEVVRPDGRGTMRAYIGG